jgi:hypothetical protein
MGWRDLVIVVWIAVSLVPLIGCATPAPLVRLHPHDEDVVWVSGRAAVEREKRGVRVAAAFEHQHGRRLGLRIEIQNLTDEEMEISADDVTFVTCNNGPEEGCSKIKQVYDPEEVLTALDETSSREHASATNDRAFATPFLILSAIGDVASIPSRKYDGVRGLQTSAIAEQVRERDAQNDRTQEHLGSERQLWADVALRRNTLYPGRGVAGLVYMPVRPKARYLWLQVQAGDRPFTFCFRQETRRVRW